MFSLIKFLLVISGTVIGVSLGYATINAYGNFLDIDNPEIKLAALFGCIGYLLMSMSARELESWLENKLESINTYELAWGTVGFLIGLIAANLLLIPLYFIIFRGVLDITTTNKYITTAIAFLEVVVPMFFNLLFGVLGLKILLKFKTYNDRLRISMCGVQPKVLDSSVIIDGRISDIVRLGFIEGQIIIPKFVINELQMLSDSTDAFKRTKGRQGLELVHKLHKEFPDFVIISEQDFSDIHQVDEKLLKLVKQNNAILVTLDYNLKKVAEIENIKVLNLNDLNNALKPMYLSGETVEVHIIKPGKDASQGVGFLADGTMIVVEDGGGHIGQTVITTVTNVLQTSAGRMIFSRINVPNAVQHSQTSSNLFVGDKSSNKNDDDNVLHHTSNSSSASQNHITNNIRRKDRKK